MAFSTILDYTGNMQLRAYTKSDHKVDTLKQGLPDPHFYCTVVINCHVSVNGDKFSVIWVVWFEAHFMRKNWCLCHGNSNGKVFLVINDSFIWEIQLKIRISHIIWIWGQSQINRIVKKCQLYSELKKNSSKHPVSHT